MEPVIVLNKEEDFKRLGLNHKKIEQWEDGQRRNSEPQAMENWYFDAIIEDGTKVVVVYMTKTGATRHLSVDSTNVRIQITTPDGKNIEDVFYLTAAESETRKGSCYLQYEPHTLTGNFVDYYIKIKPINGIGCDLHFKVKVKPFRLGTGYIAFG